MSTTKWVFTENREAETFYDSLESFFNDSTGIRYICGQLEKASTGQLHFQGYLQLSRSQRISWVKRNVSSTAHFEIQKASRNDDARSYCMKSDTQVQPFKEFGNYAKGRGARSDLTKFKDDVMNGMTRKQLMMEHHKIFAQYRHYYSTIKEINGPDPKGKEKKISIYYGAPGTGKTRKATAHCDDFTFWRQPVGSSKWFNGYDDHQVVLFDDFAGKMNKVGLVDLLKLIDRYPEYVEIKGGYTWFHPDHIIMTTNYHPRAWYNWLEREPSYIALQRRITEVLVFEDDGSIESMDPEEFFQDRDLWPTAFYRDSDMRHGYT